MAANTASNTGINTPQFSCHVNGLSVAGNVTVPDPTRPRTVNLDLGWLNGNCDPAVGRGEIVMGASGYTNAPDLNDIRNEMVHMTVSVLASSLFSHSVRPQAGRLGVVMLSGVATPTIEGAEPGSVMRHVPGLAAFGVGNITRVANETLGTTDVSIMTGEYVGGTQTRFNVKLSIPHTNGRYRCGSAIFLHSAPSASTGNSALATALLSSSTVTSNTSTLLLAPSACR
jgi:hypothetical protein